MIRRTGVVFITLVLSVAVTFAQQMPDPSLINGKAIPAPEIGNSIVSVRVVRENVGNNVPGQPVKITQGSVTRSGTTDAAGRAEF